MNYELFKAAAGVACVIGLYSVLWRENKFYRAVEHLFLGLAAGYMLVALWKETLFELWFKKMVGSPADGATAAVPGYWAYAILLPIGLMGYTVFSKKINWMSKVPIGIIIGFWAGQQVQIFWNKWGPGIKDSMKPIMPTVWGLVPSGKGVDKAEVANNIYASQALSNLVFVVTFVCVLSYFFFSFDIKNKVLKSMNTMGRWLLMIGLGAIFGSTVMGRFMLVIDRMSFVWVEFVKQKVLNIP